MEVVLRTTNKRFKKKKFQDHYYYDVESKQLLHGHGGKMIFVYDPVRKKTVPRIIDVEDWVSGNNYEEIVDWINQNNLTILYQVPNHFVEIDVSIDLWSDLEDELFGKKISFEYNEDHFKQESKDPIERKPWQNLPSNWPIHMQH